MNPALALLLHIARFLERRILGLMSGTSLAGLKLFEPSGVVELVRFGFPGEALNQQPATAPRYRASNRHTARAAVSRNVTSSSTRRAVAAESAA